MSHKELKKIWAVDSDDNVYLIAFFDNGNIIVYSYYHEECFEAKKMEDESYRVEQLELTIIPTK